jgi:hypothetical protein
MAQFHGCVQGNLCFEFVTLMRPNFMQSSWHYSAHVRAIRSKLSHHVCMALKNMAQAGGHLLISAGRAFHSCIINIRRAHSKCISPGRRKADRRIFRCVLKCTRRFIALGASFIRRLFPWRTALGRLVVDITPGSVMIMTSAHRDTRPRGLGKAVAADSKFSAIRPAPFRLRGAATPRNASSSISWPPDADGF